jgi:RHS repeat-associated protein
VGNQTETPKRYRYTGKERDEESGFYYHGARYYAAWLGRWTSADPSGIENSIGTYEYEEGDHITGREGAKSGIWTATKKPTRTRPNRTITDTYHQHIGKKQTEENWPFYHIGRGVNLYAYVFGDPISLHDPDGNQPQRKQFLRQQKEQILTGLKEEVIPSSKSGGPKNNPRSQAHKTRVIRVINFFISDTTDPEKTKYQNLMAAKKVLTKFRRTSSKYSESLILRDAQRYFWGAVGPAFWSTNQSEFEMSGKELIEERGEEDIGFTRKPGKATWMGKMWAKGADPVYNTLKQFALWFGIEKVMQTSDKPVSAVGGSYWYELGRRLRSSGLDVKGSPKRVTWGLLRKYEKLRSKEFADLMEFGRQLHIQQFEGF